MALNSITPTTRAPAPAADTPAPTAPVRQGSAVPAVEIDELTRQPVPPRFPWLSRLSQQLESAANQRPAFAPAPVLGDNLDKSA